MAQSCLNCRQVEAPPDQVDGGEVAEIVEPKVGEAGGGGGGLELTVGPGLKATVGADEVGEQEVVGVGFEAPRGRARGEQRPQPVGHAEVARAVALRLPHEDRLGLEVQIGPAEAKELALASSRIEGQQDQRQQVRRHGLEDLRLPVGCHERQRRAVLLAAAHARGRVVPHVAEFDGALVDGRQHRVVAVARSSLPRGSRHQESLDVRLGHVLQQLLAKSPNQRSLDHAASAIVGVLGVHALRPLQVLGSELHEGAMVLRCLSEQFHPLDVVLEFAQELRRGRAVSAAVAQHLLAAVADADVPAGVVRAVRVAFRGPRAALPEDVAELASAGHVDGKSIRSFPPLSPNRRTTTAGR